MTGILSLFLIILNPIFVLVGDKNNQPVDISGLGTVTYEYEIMAYEVTNYEYCLFLNSVASENDVFNLYSPIMSQSFMGGINRIKNNNKWIYQVKEGFESKPVVGVSWNSAARYVNWLNYNSDNIEDTVSIDQYRRFTEGSQFKGTYNVGSKPHRNNDATYWLPNRNEWIKALYFNGHEWNKELSLGRANIYSYTNGWAYPFPHIKDVGYNVSPSHYGTYDQLGNVAEWIEDGNDAFKYCLGGSLIRTPEYSGFNITEGDFPEKSIPSFGFRVCRTASITKRKTKPMLPPKRQIQNNASESVQIKDKNNGSYVLVDYPNNDGDIINRFKGSVNYLFYISKYELTNNEYCNFLNSVANHIDKYNLYDSNMGNGVTGGIVRMQNGDSISYKVKQGFGRKPVTYIGFYELARYANWLHYGCPVGHQVLGVTEGNTVEGAYDTSNFEAVRDGRIKPTKTFGQRNTGAKYWIPNEDEWYKAAYFDPYKIGNRKYHDYPTRTSDMPDSTMANYMIYDSYVVGNPYYLANVDDYENSASFFGTQQQGGNVWEWTESWQYGEVGVRALRGGSWQYTEYGLNAVNEDPGGINNKSYLYGGRLCKSFEPEGYMAVDSPLYLRFYNYLILMPPKHIVILCTAIMVLILILSLISLVSIIRCLKK